MKKKHKAHHFWLILGVYGVWFALFSGIEEILMGKLWKVITSLLLGLVVYVFIESQEK